jgi:hypothetical protein
VVVKREKLFRNRKVLKTSLKSAPFAKYIKRPVGTPVGTPPQHHHSIRFKEPRIHIHTLDFPHLLLHRNGAILFHLSVAVFCHDSPAGGNHS